LRAGQARRRRHRLLPGVEQVLRCADRQAELTVRLERDSGPGDGMGGGEGEVAFLFLGEVQCEHRV
jgi:hypothetical protein